ncbi:GyrI-like domain-containing protein [Nakamurella leprariae]|uniref:GyrI-like domain-containing protein n=1 Tax=Nakamurella leprariae TaxID=2803911 RepID=A0A938Y9K5_9ACTN|nr:GyrI-like domain-containing protein [Nakamurella leprariae]MBM9468375.1 GyrI-like domain-containing protein [Nakamurella leprariae]
MTVTTDRVDFKRTLDDYRAKRGEFRTLDVPARQYLAIDGSGDPNRSLQYADSIAALYPVAYALKFASKRELGRDYVVPPLEGLWWADDMDAFTARRDKAQWQWTLLIMTPDWIEPVVVDAAVAKAGRTDRPARLDDVRLRSLAEGTVVQTLHVGSYDDEAEVLARLHDEFIPANGLRMTGRHHEIYLSDPRRVAPEKLRTILRQPVG